MATNENTESTRTISEESRAMDRRSTRGPKGSTRLDPSALLVSGVQWLLVGAAIVVLLAVAVGGAAAHDTFIVEPGASGHCESGDEGGSFAHHAGDHYVNFPDAESTQRTRDAVVYFAETEGDCGGDDQRYLEVHVTSTAANAQYCYDERSDGDDGDTGHSDEPTDPVTASNGLGEVTVNDGTRNAPPGSEHEKNDNEQEACTYNRHGCEFDKNGNYTEYTCEGDSPESG